MLGAGYVIENCIASYNRKQEEKLFRIYVSDGLYALVNKTLTYESRYSEMVARMEHKEPAEKKEKSASEVKMRMKAKLGG